MARTRKNLRKPNKAEKIRRRKRRSYQGARAGRLKGVFVDSIEALLISFSNEFLKVEVPDKVGLSHLTTRATADQVLKLAEYGKLRAEVDKTLVDYPILLAQEPLPAAKTIFREFEWRLVGHLVDRVMQEEDSHGRTRYVQVGVDDDGEALYSLNEEFEEEDEVKR